MKQPALGAGCFVYIGDAKTRVEEEHGLVTDSCCPADVIQ